jgi:hypothetical protein
MDNAEGDPRLGRVLCCRCQTSAGHHKCTKNGDWPVASPHFGEATKVAIMILRPGVSAGGEADDTFVIGRMRQSDISSQ